MHKSVYFTHSQQHVRSRLVHSRDVLLNVQLVCSIFCPNIADEVLKVPILQPNGEDKLIWKHTRDGIYTVKYGYRALLEGIIGGE